MAYTSSKEDKLETDAKTAGPEGSSAPLTGIKNPGVIVAAAGGSFNLPGADAALYTTKANYGSADWGAETAPTDKEVNAHKVAKAKLAEKNAGKHTDPKNATAASQDPGKNIHDALLGADPSQAAAVLKKALQSMVMLKMMDKLTSPAGLISMASGALGGGIASIASAAGLGSLQNALNGAMPGISSLIPGSIQGALQGAMIGVLVGEATGALTPKSINNAVATTATINAAMYAIKSGQSDAVDAVASFGGPSFGLTPGTLAAKIALVGPGGVLTTTTNVNGVKVNTTVYTSTNAMTTQNIPTLTGMEQIYIAGLGMVNVSRTLGTAVGVGNTVSTSTVNIVNDLNDPTKSAAAAASMNTHMTNTMQAPTSSLSTATNIALIGLTAGALGGIINAATGDIVSQGLNKILGVGTSGLLGAVTKLLPNIGGNIQATIASHLPKTALDGGAINDLMTQATKSLSLSRAAFNVAKNIFGQSQADSIASMVGSTSAIAAVTGSFKAITPFGDVSQSTVQGIATASTAGSAIDKIVQGTVINPRISV